MKNNIQLEVDGKFENFKELLTVEFENSNEKYILYTQDKKNDINETVIYANILTKEGKEEFFSPVEDDIILEYLDNLFQKVVKMSNKDKGGSSEK